MPNRNVHWTTLRGARRDHIFCMGCGGKLWTGDRIRVENWTGAYGFRYVTCPQCAIDLDLNTRSERPQRLKRMLEKS